MLSKSQLSFIKSIQLKKFRKLHSLFIVEGLKSITEFLEADFVLSQLFYVSDMASNVANFPQKMKHYEISSSDLRKISSLKNPSGAIALFEMPLPAPLKTTEIQGKYSLVLDFVQDPGNLGTIIRIADWFGIQHIICSTDTVDCYGSKVVQASMGSLARVSIHYENLTEWLPQSGIKIYGALLDGESLFGYEFNNKNQEGLILLGNEGHGIRKEILPFIDQAITIPRVGQAESLNVAVSAALFCAELRRNLE